MRLRSYTHLRGSFLFYIFLRALHRNAGNLLPVSSGWINLKDIG